MSGHIFFCKLFELILYVFSLFRKINSANYQISLPPASIRVPGMCPLFKQQIIYSKGIKTHPAIWARWVVQDQSTGQVNNAQASLCPMSWIWSMDPPPSPRCLPHARSSTDIACPSGSGTVLHVAPIPVKPGHKSHVALVPSSLGQAVHINTGTRCSTVPELATVGTGCGMWGTHWATPTCQIQSPLWLVQGCATCDTCSGSHIAQCLPQASWSRHHMWDTSRTNQSGHSMWHSPESTKVVRADCWHSWSHVCHHCSYRQISTPKAPNWSGYLAAGQAVAVLLAVALGAAGINTAIVCYTAKCLDPWRVPWAGWQFHRPYLGHPCSKWSNSLNLRKQQKMNFKYLLHSKQAKLTGYGRNSSGQHPEHYYRNDWKKQCMLAV